MAPPRAWRPVPNAASKPPAPKNALNRSPIEPKLSLGVGEHLVGLGGLLELGLRLGVVGVDVGVQLARQAAERLLDLALVGVT
jgi:hypothetical protein